ncbi:MAG: hypothetical protein QM535_18415 [Limnohabitans sp.]|nr:hypothetical protein [Limnohabitans sp.]
MTKLFLLIIVLLTSSIAFGQSISSDYDKTIKEANSNMQDSNYRIAADLYSKAFYNNNDKGKVYDRYMLAICYTKLNKVDSAFSQLERMAVGGKFSHHDLLEGDENFNSLKNDKRWKIIIDIMKKNFKNLR